MKRVIGVAALVLLSGCSMQGMRAVTDVAAALQPSVHSFAESAQQAGQSSQAMTAQPVYVPPVTFNQGQAQQPNTRTVYIDIGEGRQRYTCTGAGANTRCWQ